jgi:hypothetical protein
MGPSGHQPTVLRRGHTGCPPCQRWRCNRVQSGKFGLSCPAEADPLAEWVRRIQHASIRERCVPPPGMTGQVGRGRRSNVAGFLPVRTAPQERGRRGRWPCSTSIRASSSPRWRASVTQAIETLECSVGLLAAGGARRSRRHSGGTLRTKYTREEEHQDRSQISAHAAGASLSASAIRSGPEAPTNAPSLHTSGVRIGDGRFQRRPGHQGRW